MSSPPARSASRLSELMDEQVRDDRVRGLLNRNQYLHARPALQAAPVHLAPLTPPPVPKPVVEPSDNGTADVVPIGLVPATPTRTIVAKDSLELSLAVLTKKRERGEALTDEEVHLIERIASFRPHVAATPRQPASLSLSASTSRFLGRSLSPANKTPGRMLATDAEEISNRLASAGKESATFESRMKDVLRFTLACSAIEEDSLADVVRLSTEELSALLNCTADVIAVIDGMPVHYDSVDMDLVEMNDDFVSKCLDTNTTLTSGRRLVIPLAHNGEVVGALDVDAEPDTPKSVVEAAASIVTLTLLKGISRLESNFEKEKAETMVRMAEVLSRNNLDEVALAQDIISMACELIEVDRCSVFLVKDDSKLKAVFFDGRTVKIDKTVGIAGHVATTGETVNIRDAYQDPRFNKEVDKKTGYRTQSILCMPVFFEDQMVAVAQLINKRKHTMMTPRACPSALAVDEESTHYLPFTARDEKLFSSFSVFIGVCLRNCSINNNLLREKAKSEKILEVASQLSDTDIRDVHSVATFVMKGAKELLQADRGSLFLRDVERNELYSTVADDTQQEIRFPVGRGIAGAVARTGTAENILDAYQDERFNKEIDRTLGYKTTSILAEPISCRGEVIAVAQLVNKLNEDNECVPFTAEDSSAFQVFAMFAGVSLNNSHLLEFAVRAGKEAMELNGLRSEGLNSPRSGAKRGAKCYGVTPEACETIQTLRLDDEVADTLFSRDFDMFAIRAHPKSLDVCTAAVVQIFQRSGLLEQFNCSIETMTRFVLACRSKYRSVPYHNFFHAVDACQTIHTFLYEGKASEFIQPVECYALLVAALVHDLDHMGLNNSFYLKTDSPLGLLSSASGNLSVLEVHHCSIAVDILGEDNMNVFGGLGKEDQNHAFKCMIDCVLATDMARHGEMMKRFGQIVDEGYSKGNDDHRRFAMEMLMKAADISNVTKPFHISRMWGQAVTEEFYRQGDMEKEQGIEVAPMFDRSLKTELAKGQLGFIGFLGEPFFKSLVRLFEGIHWTVENIERNKASWSRKEGSVVGPLPTAQQDK